ncbi:MAG: translation initiation factor IF-2 [Clostridium sp.]|nr:translation initiation factor IF-2 [Clostridium sp.]
MAKLRVYELAKSLNKDSKEIIEMLKKSGVEVKNHMSSVSEEDEKKIRERCAGKKTPEKAEMPAKGAGKPETKPVSAAASTTGQEKKEVSARPQTDRREGEQNNRKEGDRREAGGIRKEGDRREAGGVRREGDRREAAGIRREGDRREAGGVRREGDRREAGGVRREGDRNGRPQGDRREFGGPRREGDRNGRPQGDRREFGGPRREGDRNGRPQGDRREFGGPRREGDRNGRPQGDRREFGGPRREGDRNGRPQGDRRDFGGNRGGRRDDRREEKLSIPAPMDRASMDRDRADRHKDKKERDKSSLFEDGDSRKKRSKKDEHFTVKGTKPVKKPVQKPKPKEPEEPVIRTIELPEVLTVQELADKVKTPVSQMIKKLFLAGEMVTVNTDLDFEKAAEIALEYNCIAEEEVKVDVIEEMLKEEEEDEALMRERPPVVCVMGHVDHGKTSLLDAIRETSVTSGEAGGITQHIGAYTVEANGQQITFLDTPGHEAFTAMRMRGAQSTDIAILVVAADDGVMPQTVEAINHAKAAGIEIIVAVNKIDKESANIERVKQELVEYELIAEDWGGSTVFCPVSAHTKEGIENLLEMILLTAEVLELKANPDRKARGIVIEAELDKGRGPVATVLVQKGTLKIGDSIAVGSSFGRVRAMINDKGQNVKEAGPSQPVEILGLNGVPAAGEIFVATKNEKEARSMAETYIACDKEKLLAETKAKMSLDDLFSQIQAGNVKELNLVVKADVQGSVEAVKQSLLKLSNEEVVIKVIHAGVGAINESDVILASASNAIIIGFNIRPDAQAKDVAEREKVDLRLYKVIYNAIEDIEAAMKGMLDPVFEEKVTGHLVIRQTFKASGVGTIAGSFVLDGLIRRSSSVRVTRDGEQIYEGPLASLKRFKDDVKEVKNGFECGIVLEEFNDLKEDDQIEAYEMVEVPR